MPSFRRTLSSYNEDVFLEKPMKDHKHSQELLYEMKRVSKAKQIFKKIGLVNLSGFKRIWK